MPARPQYESLASLLDYPGPDYPARVSEVARQLRTRYPAAAAKLDALDALVHSEEATLCPEALDRLQEIFTRTFDVQAITTLGVGYVMFGDDYKRGEVLVNLNREHRDAGVDCGHELPDHLPTVLRLVARWSDEELVQEFVEEILVPAVGRMVQEFDTERMEQRNRLYKKHFKTLIATSAHRGTMFRLPLEALRVVLREDFDLTERRLPLLENDFLRSINRELDIEAHAGLPNPSGNMP